MACRVRAPKRANLPVVGTRTPTVAFSGAAAVSRMGRFPGLGLERVRLKRSTFQQLALREVSAERVA